MTRRPARDERQVELFCLPDPPPAPVKRARRLTRSPKEEPAADPAPQLPGEEVAARLTPVELDDFVRALSDENLAHLVMAATRDLKRRLARSGIQRRSRPTRKGVSDLERVVQQVADEFREAAPTDEW
jgi:hypothetical protein